MRGAMLSCGCAPPRRLLLLKVRRLSIRLCSQLPSLAVGRSPWSHSSEGIDGDTLPIVRAKIPFLGLQDCGFWWLKAGRATFVSVQECRECFAEKLKACGGRCQGGSGGDSLVLGMALGEAGGGTPFKSTAKPDCRNSESKIPSGSDEMN